MCGIVGIAASAKRQNYLNRKDFFQQALYVDAVRGIHSTGMFMVPYDKKGVFTFKKAMQPADFLDMSTTLSLMTKLDDTLYAVGHNRHATKGGVSNKMAHPFTHGSVTLVHNGTLTTHAHLPSGSNFISDSECIAHAFNEKSPEEIIPELRGAFALVWYDSKDGKLHLVRNKERPLSFGFDEKTDTMLIGSESKMIEWLAIRNGFEIKKVYDLNPGYEIMLGDKDFRNYEHRKHTLYTPPVYNYSPNSDYYKNNGAYSGGASYAGSGNNRSSKKSSLEKPTVRGDEALIKKLNIDDFKEADIFVEAFIPYPGYKSSPSKEVFGYLKGSLVEASVNHEVVVQGVAESQWAWAVNQYLTVVVRAVREEDGLIVVQANQPNYSDLNNDPKIVSDGDTNDTIAMVYGPNREMITVDAFDKLARHGCANCGANIEADEHMEVVWTDAKQPICPVCAAVMEEATNV